MANLWIDPATAVTKPFKLPMLTGCENLSFKPELHFSPSSSAAGEPSGMTFTLHEPEEEVNPECTRGSRCPPVASTLKKLALTLPAGVTVSSSSAGGLTACQNLQVRPRQARRTRRRIRRNSERKGEARRVPLKEPAREGGCPEESKVGTVEVTSPDLPQEESEGHKIGPAPLTGALYVAQPECAPCSEAQAQAGELFRLFLQLTDKKAGIVIKLVGKTRPTP